MSDSNTARGPAPAGLLDIRNIIGGLLGVYGVILTLMGIFGDTELDKTGDVNANLWAGLVLLVGGGGVPASGRGCARWWSRSIDEDDE